MEQLSELDRLKFACRQWAAEHTALLVAIHQAGFMVQYEPLETYSEVRAKRPVLAPLPQSDSQNGNK